MTQIRWQTVFDTGIPEVDDQHKKLVGMINQLETANALGGDTADHEMGLVLRKLVDYTQYHFEREEHVMEEIGFVGRKDHVSMHKELVKKIRTFLLKLKDQGRIDINELMKFLRDWLLDHIVCEDSKIGDAYEQRAKNTVGVKPS